MKRLPSFLTCMFCMLFFVPYLGWSQSSTWSFGFGDAFLETDIGGTQDTVDVSMGDYTNYRRQKLRFTTRLGCDIPVSNKLHIRLAGQYGIDTAKEDYYWLLPTSNVRLEKRLHENKAGMLLGVIHYQNAGRFTLRYGLVGSLNRTLTQSEVWDWQIKANAGNLVSTEVDTYARVPVLAGALEASVGIFFKLSESLAVGIDFNYGYNFERTHGTETIQQDEFLADGTLANSATTTNTIRSLTSGFQTKVSVPFFTLMYTPKVSTARSIDR